MTVTATHSSSLSIVDSDNPSASVAIQRQSTETLDVLKGPSPGAIACNPTGVEPDLSELTLGGPVLIENQSSTTDNDAIVGIWDGDSFFPLFDVPPGKTLKAWLSRFLGEEMTSGTGTVSSAGSLMIKMRVESAVVVIYGYSS